jgi:hypothetical protein
MKRMAAADYAANLRDAQALADMLAAPTACWRPSRACTAWPSPAAPAVAACISLLARRSEIRARSETGLWPATISPHVLRHRRASGAPLLLTAEAGCPDFSNLRVDPH